MSQRDDVSGGDAGTDEEFMDRSMPEQTAAPGPESTERKTAQRGKQAKPPTPKRGPSESKEPKPKESKPESMAKQRKPEPHAEPPATSVVKGEMAPEPAPGRGPGTTDTKAPEKQPVLNAKRPAGREKPERPAKPPRKTRTRAPRDPGGYPEFHAPARARKDSKPAQTIVFLHGGNVGNWSWDPQVRAFGDYEVLTPDLPGFGARAQEDWAGLDSAADDVAAVIADEVSNGGAHLVGLSLGGVVALRVLARHPELVESLLISGVPAAGVSASMRTMSRMQLRLFGSEWYWRFQAGAYGMVDDEKDLFTEHGTALRADNMRAIMDEVDPGGVPARLGDYKGPVLVIAGSKEPKVVAKSFPALARALPQARFRTAAGMHHQWNIEDPILFNATVRAWIEKGATHPRLQEASAPDPSSA